MKVTVFNVEHGFCAFMRTPTNHTLLIDCGSTAAFSPPAYLKQHEFSSAAGWGGFKLTDLVITHPHDDHIDDIASLVATCPPAILHRQEYDWEEVKESENGLYDNLDDYTEWQETYNTTPVQFPDYGMKIEHFCLTPDEAKEIDEPKFVNNSSIVTVATVVGSQYQEKFLFGGDMETAGWEALLSKYPAFEAAVKEVDFFIVSHHGHTSGFSQELYNVMGKRPILNIVSIHRNDEHIDTRYSSEKYASGTTFGGADRRCLTTRSDGSITIYVDGSGKFSVSGQNLAYNRAA